MTTMLDTLENEVQQMADYLISGYWLSTAGGNVSAHNWATSTITYNITDLTSDEKLFAKAALNLWQEVASITFVESGGDANITFTNDGSGTAATDAEWSGSAMTSAIVKISTDWKGGLPPDRNLNTGLFQTYIHEIGHALGLGHQGPYNGERPSDTYNFPFPNDSRLWSVMSYRDQPTADDGSFAFAVTPQIVDIYAIQQIYGANTGTRQGDSVYDWNNTVGALATSSSLSVSGAISYTIYDTGGHDTLFARPDAFYSQTVDLRPGEWSSIGGATSNIVIYFGSVIEEARGGGGGDKIYGNNTANSIFGLGGNDTIDGGDGDDILEGGDGDDDLAGGLGNDIVAGGLGNEIIRWHGGSDVLSGGGGNDGFFFTKGSGQTVVNGGFGTDIAYFEGTSAEYIIEFINQESLRDGATRDVLVRRGDQPSTTFQLTDVESVVFGDLSVNLRYSGVLGYALDGGILYKIGYDLQRTVVPGFQMDNSWGSGYSSLATISVDNNGIIHASGGEFRFRNSNLDLGGFHAEFDPETGGFPYKATALDGLQFKKSNTAASAIGENGNFYVVYNDMTPLTSNSYKTNVFVSYDNSDPAYRNYLKEYYGITGDVQNERFIDRVLWVDAADFGPDGYLYTLRNLQGYTATEFYIQKSSLDRDGVTQLREEESFFLDVGTADSQLQDISFTADGVLIGIDRYRDVVRIDLDTGHLETLGRLGGFDPSTAYNSNGQAWWPVRNFDFDIVGTYADLLEALGRAESYRPFADAEAPYQTSQGQRLLVAATDGLLKGDIDADGDALIAQLVSGPKNGMVSLLVDGSFSYAPNAGFSGRDSFVYQASDGELTSNLVTISIDVAPSEIFKAKRSDMNGDGSSDILFQSGGTLIEWFMQNGGYQSGLTLTTGVSGFDVKAIGDFNGDGIADISLQCGGSVVNFLLNADGSYKSGYAVANGLSGFEVVGSGDFNGDGTSDLLLQDGGTLVNFLLDTNGQYMAGNTITTSANGFDVKAVGDFNGDGVDDIMLQNGGTIVDFLLNASGTYMAGNTITTTATGFEVRGAGDFNGDGIDDIVLQNGGTVVEFLLNSAGSYASGATLTTTATGFDVVGTGDYNGDGTSDMLLYDGSTVVQWTLQNGAYLAGSTIATGLTGFDLH